MSCKKYLSDGSMVLYIPNYTDVSKQTVSNEISNGIKEQLTIQIQDAQKTIAYNKKLLQCITKKTLPITVSYKYENDRVHVYIHGNMAKHNVFLYEFYCKMPIHEVVDWLCSLHVSLSKEYESVKMKDINDYS